MILKIPDGCECGIFFCAPISFLTLSTFFKNKNRENAYVFVVLYIVFNRCFITGGYIYIGLVSYHPPYTVYGV